MSKQRDDRERARMAFRQRVSHRARIGFVIEGIDPDTLYSLLETIREFALADEELGRVALLSVTIDGQESIMPIGAPWRLDAALSRM